MTTILTIKVIPEWQGILHTLPCYHGWNLTDEKYNEDGSGTITIETDEEFSEETLPYYTELALNSNINIIEWKLQND